MQLYDLSFSPYAARCRLQSHHKQLPVTLTPAPGGPGSVAMKALTPLGKVPMLIEDGKALGESWAIMEYLEGRFPQTPMLPTDAMQTAQLRELVRFTDLYLAPAMFPLFKALRAPVAESAMTEMLQGLTAQHQLLEAYLARKPQPLALDLADAALLPVVWYSRLLVKKLAGRDVMDSLPNSQAWWTRVSIVPAATKVITEMDSGLRAAMPALFPAA